MRITREYANPAGFSQGLGAGHGRNCTAPAESAYSFPMTCACQTAHGFPCQFPGETDFFDFDGRTWCRFHLPLQDAAGNKSDKGRGDEGWEEGGEEWLLFNTVVFEHVTKKINAVRNVPTSFSAKKFDIIISKLEGQQREVDFRRVAFPEMSNFCGHLSQAKALYINFEYATFGGNSNFSQTPFSSEFNFTRTIFYGEVNFDNSSFMGIADFTGVVFEGRTSFYETKFENEKKEVSFKDAKFANQVSFNNAAFASQASFEGTTFSAEASFYCATFSPRTSFEKAKFYGKANFTHANIGDETSFKEAEFGGEVEFASDRTENGHFKRMDFSRAIFKGPCRFTNRKFTAEANFNGAVFHDLVEFHGCEFHQDMSFHQTKFLKTRGEDDDKTEELERSYRTLKLGMEGLRARNEEADFFALEMDCRRQRRSVDWTERLAACLYKHLSDYGRSLVLPLLFFLLLLDVFFLIFGCFALAAKDPESIRLAGFTLQQVFRPFYVWGDVPKGAENGLVAAYPPLIPLLASLQSLITIGLLTLFLLALRRRFKMD